MITSHVSEPTSVDSSLSHRFKRHPHTGQRGTAWMSLFLFLSTKNGRTKAQQINMGEGIPQMASFHRKRLRWRMQTFAGAVANVCGGGCKRLRERLQCFASEKGKTGTEIASPILDKRVPATVLARTCGKNTTEGVFVNLTSVAPPP